MSIKGHLNALNVVSCHKQLIANFLYFFAKTNKTNLREFNRFVLSIYRQWVTKSAESHLFALIYNFRST